MVNMAAVQYAGNASGTILLDHGTGARLSRELVEMIAADLGPVYVGEMEDSAIISVPSGQLAVTTDSFVVQPAFFGNGDIGKVAVCGTVNDLAVSGATPRFLTVGLILEAGFPIAALRRTIHSIRAAAEEASVKIIAGDTKVVGKGAADQLFVNTTGVGVFHRRPLRMADVQPGDRIILSGQIGNHAIHLLSIRAGLGFEQRVQSDCAPLNGMVEELLASLPEGPVRSIRDVTRGGLCAVMHEYSRAIGCRMELRRDALPVRWETAMCADMLGIDVVHLANEGCIALFVAAAWADVVLARLRSHRYGQDAAIVGTVGRPGTGGFAMTTGDGSTVEIEELLGAEIPRLC
jgi:hydrogenase expression/formation protein HypE